jgi:hypothetical protein
VEFGRATVFCVNLAVVGKVGRLDVDVKGKKVLGMAVVLGVNGGLAVAV